MSELKEKKERKEVEAQAQVTPTSQEISEQHEEKKSEQQDISKPNEQKQIERKTIEQWAFDLRIPSWQLAALKKANNYASGKSLTRSEFETALKNAMNKKF